MSGESQVFNKWCLSSCWGNISISRQTQWRWITDLNKAKTAKLLKESIGQFLYNLQWFLTETTKPEKRKPWWIGLHQNSKSMVIEMTRQDPNWENIFTVHIPDKYFVSRIYKEFWQFNNKMMKTQIFLNGQSLEQNKRRYISGHKELKTFILLIIFIFREMQIKATMKYYYIPTRMIKTEKTNTTKQSWVMKQLKLLCITVVSVKIT